jgi:hypothetical protein
LSQVFFLPWYSSSWVSGEPHHSGFNSQLVTLSLWCVMFLVWKFFCKESFECCPGIVIIIIIIIIIINISCHGLSFFPGTSLLEPVVNPTTQASSLSL